MLLVPKKFNCLLSCSPNSYKTEFIEEPAQSVDYAQSLNTNIILSGDYNLSYPNIDGKDSLDAFLHHSFDVSIKTIPTDAKSLFDYIINNLCVKDRTKKSNYLHL